MIYHIIPRREWQAALAEGIYEPAGFAREGFIHCSAREQLLGTANYLFADVRDLLVLCIDPELCEAELVYENLEGGEVQFPHLYGLLKVSAVIKAVALNQDGQGLYQLPAGLV